LRYYTSQEQVSALVNGTLVGRNTV